MKAGDRLVVHIDSIAHGGHCIARSDGRVIFVRHAIPGEKVQIEITDLTSSFARADCVEVIEASPDRVDAPCTFAHPGGCGGCDFQHISIQRQRVLKSEIIVEQFARIAKMDVKVDVEAVEPVSHWRTRMEFTVSPNRKLAMYASRSHELIEIDNCHIADRRIDIDQVNQAKLPVGKKVSVVVSDDARPATVIEGRENLSLINEHIDSRKFSLNPESFWQSHIHAPQTLVDAVRQFAGAKVGDHIFDLYGGVGLFTAGLLEQVGAGGRITLIESDQRAVTDARRNFAEAGNVEIVEARVERVIDQYVAGDIVILDPPRSGAGKKVVDALLQLRPRTIVYVACDPAALARDSRYLVDGGYRLDGLRAFDLFPMTQHIESVARFIAGN